MGALRTLDDIPDMLESTGRFRCLRRVPQIKECDLRPAEDGALIGILIDCEATGIDPERATPIEIAMIKFAYDLNGKILHLVDVFEALEEPDDQLADEVSALTGLTMDDLKGHHIDVGDLIRFISDANILVAHNARYDRVLVEAWIEGMPLRPLACTLVVMRGFGALFVEIDSQLVFPCLGASPFKFQRRLLAESGLSGSNRWEHEADIDVLSSAG